MSSQTDLVHTRRRRRTVRFAEPYPRMERIVYVGKGHSSAFQSCYCDSPGTPLGTGTHWFLNVFGQDRPSIASIVIAHLDSLCIVGSYRALSHGSIDDKCRADQSLEHMGCSQRTKRRRSLVRGAGG